MSVWFDCSHREYRPIFGSAVKRPVILPVIITSSGLLVQFAQYLYLNRRKSRSWQDAATFAIQLLIEYTEAYCASTLTPRELFIAFSNALFTGTVEDGYDPSGLYWYARKTEDARVVIGHITAYTDWFAKSTGNDSIQLNPWRDATSAEQRLNWAAFCHRRDNAFLSHLWVNSQRTDLRRSVYTENFSIENMVPTKAFPEEELDALLAKGFRRRARDKKGQIDLRNTLITMLMHYGGLRISEALSLWSDDVTIEKGEVVVRVYHPEEGLAPDGKLTRAVFLQRQYSLQSRNRLVKAKDPLFLGWKGSLITDPIKKCFEVFFFPHEAGELFARLWRDYHLTQRRKPNAGEDHPYAFTNKKGKPYTHRLFRASHKLAVLRIALAYGKLYGTTPHGHRHAYGQRLAEAQASPLLVKTAMHHLSIHSSEVYTRASLNHPGFRGGLNS